MAPLKIERQLGQLGRSVLRRRHAWGRMDRFLLFLLAHLLLCYHHLLARVQAGAWMARSKSQWHSAANRAAEAFRHSRLQHAFESHRDLQMRRMQAAGAAANNSLWLIPSHTQPALSFFLSFSSEQHKHRSPCGRTDQGSARHGMAVHVTSMAQRRCAMHAGSMLEDCTGRCPSCCPTAACPGPPSAPFACITRSCSCCACCCASSPCFACPLWR
jgi:hypothetical protein